MKKNFKTIFASMLAVLSCASCSQSDDIASDQDLTPKALVISLPKTATTRNVEDQLLVDADPKFTNVTTIYYDGGGNATVSPWKDEEVTAKKQTILKVIKPAGGVQVIVNLPASQDYSAIKTKADVDKLLAAIAIADQNLELVSGTATSAQLTTYSGFTEGSAITSEGEGTAAAVNKVTVEISSVSSRFEIGTIVAKAGSGVKDLEIEAVIFNNYLSVNTDAVANVINLDQTALKAETTIASWAKIAGDKTNVTAAAGSKAYAFQAFAGTVIPQIIFKVKGTVLTGYKLADGTGSATEDVTFTGKYITINGFKDNAAAQLTALVPHTIYQVAIGKALDISEEDITDEPNQEEVGLEVTITVKAWSKETLTPEIQ